MATYHVSNTELLELLSKLRGPTTFAPSPTTRAVWVEMQDCQAAVDSLGQARASQSPKGFFTPSAESMGRYGPAASDATATETQAETTTVIGVRACELRARNYLDKVFLEGDFQDDAYRRRRDGMVVVSADCVECADSCFCSLLGGQPFPTDRYDVNLTSLGDGFVMDVATDRGADWIGPERLDKLPQASPEQLARRDQLREKAIERIKQQNAQFGFSATDEKQMKLPDDTDQAWQQFAADCVECGACTNICPTCHCFYLYDQTLGPEEFERVRTWDSCLLSSYHRMAGGASMKLTPRPDLYSRLANRVLHKITYSPQQYGLGGCVGCGRCIDGCIGAIDIRDVLKELGQ